MLTPAQLATLKTYILAQTDLAAAVAAGQDGTVADYLNTVATPSYYVWRSSTGAAAIADAITWANLTPVDAPDGSQLQTNRLLLCQAKQMNLQILLQGRESVATDRANLRAGLSDALTNVPSGPGGALQDAGWLGAGKVKATISRPATRVEVLFASGSGTAGTPSTLGLEGPLNSNDVAEALRGPQQNF